MKNSRKVISLVMALVLVFAISAVSTFAANIGVRFRINTQTRPKKSSIADITDTKNLTETKNLTNTNTQTVTATSQAQEDTTNGNDNGNGKKDANGQYPKENELSSTSSSVKKVANTGDAGIAVAGAVTVAAAAAFVIAKRK